MTANPTIGCRVFATVCRLTSACPPVRLMSPPRHSCMNEMDWQCLRWVLSLSQCDLLNSQLNSHLQVTNMNINFRILRFPRLRVSLSRIQTLVGLAAGMLSITGAFVAFFKPAPDKGKLVAIVQDAKTEKAVSDATIEILTPMDVLVTTLKPNSSGEAHCWLGEGQYRVRASHPRYLPEVRDVHLISNQNTEVHVQLRTGSSFGNAIRRVIRH